jgi:beta-glucanase (GH16 family)
MSDEFTSSWSIQDWGKEPTSEFPIRMQNSRSNVYFVSADSRNSSSKMVMRTHRFDQFHSSAEIESVVQNILYASIRVRARVYGASGAVAGFFTYRNGRNESDIEILTRDDPTEIRYSNQPVTDDRGDEIRGSSTKVNMTSQDTTDGTQAEKLKKRKTPTAQIKYDDWHTHRMDWVHGESSWFVDGEHFLDKKYGVPTVASSFIMNLWSDGGVWSGNMTKGKSAYAEIEFVEMAFNTTGDDRGSANSKVRRATRNKCDRICVIDDVAVVGTPEGAKGGAFKKAVNPWSLGVAMLVAGVLSF